MAPPKRDHITMDDALNTSKRSSINDVLNPSDANDPNDNPRPLRPRTTEPGQVETTVAPLHGQAHQPGYGHTAPAGAGYGVSYQDNTYGGHSSHGYTPAGTASQSSGYQYQGHQYPQNAPVIVPPRRAATILHPTQTAPEMAGQSRSMAPSTGSLARSQHPLSGQSAQMSSAQRPEAEMDATHALVPAGRSAYPNQSAYGQPGHAYQNPLQPSGYDYGGQSAGYPPYAPPNQPAENWRFPPLQFSSPFETSAGGNSSSDLQVGQPTQQGAYPTHGHNPTGTAYQTLAHQSQGHYSGYSQNAPPPQPPRRASTFDRQAHGGGTRQTSAPSYPLATPQVMAGGLPSAPQMQPGYASHGHGGQAQAPTPAPTFGTRELYAIEHTNNDKNTFYIFLRRGRDGADEYRAMQSDTLDENQTIPEGTRTLTHNERLQLVKPPHVAWRCKNAHNRLNHFGGGFIAINPSEMKRCVLCQARKGSNPTLMDFTLPIRDRRGKTFFLLLKPGHYVEPHTGRVKRTADNKFAGTDLSMKFEAKVFWVGPSYQELTLADYGPNASS